MQNNRRKVVLSHFFKTSKVAFSFAMFAYVLPYRLFIIQQELQFV